MRLSIAFGLGVVIATCICLITSPVAMAANPTPAGIAGDGIADLIVDGTTAFLDTNGEKSTFLLLLSVGDRFLPQTLAELNGETFSYFSSASTFNAELLFPPASDNIADPGLPVGRFMIAFVDERSSSLVNGYDSGFGPQDYIIGTIPLGQLYNTLPGSGSFSDISNDLDFRYTVLGAVGEFDGDLIAIVTEPPVVPEPSTFILAALALVGLVACHRRRRA